MIPYIVTPFGRISSFVLMIMMAFLAMIASVHIKLRSAKNLPIEEAYIFPKIVAAALIGLASAAVFDSLFKIKINGGFKLSGITFYGGLIGASVCLYFLLKYSKHISQYSAREWFDILTVPLVIFHIFGRIGCFLAGCCYGKTTTSILGVSFPDNTQDGIYHFGKACYPTQLFEVFALLISLFFISKCRNKFECYLVCYAIARFFIEFLRGDNRGCISAILSPAQIISLLILFAIAVYKIKLTKDRNFQL